MDVSSPPAPARTFDIEAVRADFPLLEREINGHPLVYFDNAATSQKPRRVIERLEAYYAEENSNVHRGVHTLSQRATDAYEEARRVVQRHLNAAHEHEIIFTSGTTAAINLVAYSYGGRFVGEGDEIVVTAMEHHANLVPWQLLCERAGATLRFIPFDDRGVLDTDALPDLLTERTRLVAFCAVSNALGTINPVEEIIDLAHERDIPVLIDGAQAVPHRAVDVQALDCDFFCFSAHKALGPTGMGVLYGKERWLEAMPPFLSGGDMIETVTLERTTFNRLPHKFEAGTPHIAGVIGMAEGLSYLADIGLDNVSAVEDDLLAYATEAVSALDGIRFIGTAPEKASVLSFIPEGAHPYDVGVMLDTMGIATRTGHHCTQPIMDRFGIPGTVRASLAFYNTRAEIDRFVEALTRALQVIR